MTTARQPGGHLSVGQFSRATALSIRMLRHYDERGLLTPAFTDPRTGYRYYTQLQLRDAGRIRTLRDLGFGVSAITGLLSAPPEVLERALTAHRAELEADARRVADRLHALDGLLAHADDLPVSLDLRRTRHPAQTVVALRRVIASYDDESLLWAELTALLPPTARVVGPGMAAFHDPDFRDADADVEIALPVAEPVAVQAPLTCREWPSHDVVVATLNGPYDQMPEVTQAAAAWIGDHGLAMSGAMFNRYLVSPAHNLDPAAWVTEVCLTVVEDP